MCCRCHLKDAVEDRRVALKRAHGVTAFEYLLKDSRLNNIFNAAMSNTSTIIMDGILATYTGFDTITGEGCPEESRGNNPLEKVCTESITLDSGIFYNTVHHMCYIPRLSSWLHSHIYTSVNCYCNRFLIISRNLAYCAVVGN